MGDPLYVFAEICTVSIFLEFYCFQWQGYDSTWFLFIIFLIWGTQYLKVLSRETEALSSKYYGQRLEFRGGWPHNCIVCLLKKFRILGNEISFTELNNILQTMCKQVRHFCKYFWIFNFKSKTLDSMYISLSDLIW